MASWRNIAPDARIGGQQIRSSFIGAVQTLMGFMPGARLAKKITVMKRVCGHLKTGVETSLTPSPTYFLGAAVKNTRRFGSRPVLNFKEAK